MEAQEELETPIGNKEPETLKAEKVKVVDIKIEPVGEKKMDKVVFTCKHPAREENITISKVKYVRNDKIQVSGSWFTLDEDKKLQKGSAVVKLLNFYAVNILVDLIGKELETDVDSEGYLCLKAY